MSDIIPDRFLIHGFVRHSLLIFFYFKTLILFLLSNMYVLILPRLPCPLFTQPLASLRNLFPYPNADAGFTLLRSLRVFEEQEFQGLALESRDIKLSSVLPKF